MYGKPTDAMPINHRWSGATQPREPAPVMAPAFKTTVLPRTNWAGKPSKPVIDLQTGIRYETVRDASAAAGLSHTSISRICDGKSDGKTPRRFQWAVQPQKP